MQRIFQLTFGHFGTTLNVTGPRLLVELVLRLIASPARARSGRLTPACRGGGGIFTAHRTATFAVAARPDVVHAFAFPLRCFTVRFLAGGLGKISLVLFFTFI